MLAELETTVSTFNGACFLREGTYRRSKRDISISDESRASDMLYLVQFVAVAFDPVRARLPVVRY